MISNSKPADRWEALAAVARERADEETIKASMVSDEESAGLHMEQQAYLLRLAEVYERRARDSSTSW